MPIRFVFYKVHNIIVYQKENCKMNILKKTLSFLLAASMTASAGWVAVQAEEPASTTAPAVEETTATAAPEAEEPAGTPEPIVVEPQTNEAAAKLKKLNKSDWTICVYMCGTDLESGYGAATNDLIEMLEADIPNDVTLLVMTGGTKEWNPQEADKTAVKEKRIKKNAYKTPDNEHTQIYRVDDDNMSLVYTYKENLNMGSAQTLAEFVEFALAYAPSENLMVECWDHGGGPTGGVELDEYTGDIISIADVSRTAEAIYNARGEKTEIFGFDTCLTSNIETVSALAPYGEYLVASEEVEPGSGWYYLWLNVLNEANKAKRTAEPIEIGKRIVDEYGKTNNLNDTWENSLGLTLNLIDLSQAPKALEALDNMAKELNEKLDKPDEYADIARATEDVQKTYQGMTGVVDLYDFAYKQLDNLETAQAVIDAIGTPPGNTPEYFIGDVQGENPLVLYRGTGVTLNNSLGVGFYYPTIQTIIGNEEDSASKRADIYDTVSTSESYASYIRELLLKTDKLQVFTGSLKTNPDLENSTFYLEFTPAESAMAISDVMATCQMTKKNSDGSKTVYSLGSVDVAKDWDNLRFEAEFDGTWYSLGGEFFTCKKAEIYDGLVIAYMIPIKVEGSEGISIMSALADAQKPEEAVIISVADLDAEGIETRSYIPEGEFTFSTLLSEAEDETKFLCNDPITIKPETDENGYESHTINIEKTKLTRGSDVEYAAYFQAVDIKGNEYLSDPCGYIFSENPDDYSIKDIEPQIYTGKPVEPKITLMMGEHELFLDKNVAVEYSNNTEKGIGKVTVAIKDDEGEVFATPEKNFEIVDVTSIFDDVRTDDWYFGNVAYMHSNGYMQGVGDNKFGSATEMTRGMFAEMLYRFADEQIYRGENVFEDVPDDAYYAAAVGWAKKNGIISGVSETKFDPNAVITRESVAALLKRYAEYKKMSVSQQGDLSEFEDNTLVSDWAKDSVVWAVGSGLMSGRGDAELVPQGNVTRAETAALIDRFVKLSGTAEN